MRLPPEVLEIFLCSPCTKDSRWGSEIEEEGGGMGFDIPPLVLAVPKDPPGVVPNSPKRETVSLPPVAVEGFAFH